jgi:hypothetical protein
MGSRGGRRGAPCAFRRDGFPGGRLAGLGALGIHRQVLAAHRPPQAGNRRHGTPDLLHAIHRQGIHRSASPQVTVSGRPRGYESRAPDGTVTAAAGSGQTVVVAAETAGQRKTGSASGLCSIVSPKHVLPAFRRQARAAVRRAGHPCRPVQRRDPRCSALGDDYRLPRPRPALPATVPGMEAQSGSIAP